MYSLLQIPHMHAFSPFSQIPHMHAFSLFSVVSFVLFCAPVPHMHNLHFSPSHPFFFPRTHSSLSSTSLPLSSYTVVFCRFFSPPPPPRPCRHCQILLACLISNPEKINGASCHAPLPSISSLFHRFLSLLHPPSSSPSLPPRPRLTHMLILQHRKP